MPLRTPTVPVVCPTAEDTVLVAALIRALVATMIDDERAGAPVDNVRDCVLSAAHWRAAHEGLDGTLVDLRLGGMLRPAWEVVDELVATVSPALLRHGDIEPVVAQLAGCASTAPAPHGSGGSTAVPQTSTPSWPTWPGRPSHSEHGRRRRPGLSPRLRSERCCDQPRASVISLSSTRLPSVRSPLCRYSSVSHRCMPGRRSAVSSENCRSTYGSSA
jgi:hypothetical protein